MKIHKRKSRSDGSPHEFWYDRHIRCWFAAKVVSEEGDIGPTVDAYTREEIISLIDDGWCQD